MELFDRDFSISIIRPLGAPSPTAVITTDRSIDVFNLDELVRAITHVLRTNNISLSKVAVLGPQIDQGTLSFKFIQLRSSDHDRLKYETNINCGNSMISAGIIALEEYALMLSRSKEIKLLNIDTGMLIHLIENEDSRSYTLSIPSLIGKDISYAKIDHQSERIEILGLKSKVNITLLDLINPYIIVNALDLNITSVDEILKLSRDTGNIFESVYFLRQQIIKKYRYEDSEFPKIALVLREGDNVFAARTVYLNDWHRGLPITGIISIAAATKINNSVINYNGIDELTICSPTSNHNVLLTTNKDNCIARCEIKGIVVNKEIIKPSLNPEKLKLKMVR